MIDSRLRSPVTDPERAGVRQSADSRGFAEPPPVFTIEPSRGWIPINFRELWAYRELLYFLVWRDIKVRYKQTFFGAGWAVVQPLATMVVFTIFFNRIAKIDSDGAPYPLFSYAGLLPWTFFSNGLSKASNSLVGSASLLRKVYFPRLITPMSSVLAGGFDFGIAFLVLLLLMGYYGFVPAPQILLFPVFLLLAAATALGVGLWLSALNAEFRDVRYVIPFFVHLLLFVTPVIYPTSKVTAKLGELGLPIWLYGLNPMAGVIQGFRWSLLGSEPPPQSLLLVGTSLTLTLLAFGLFYFRRMEHRFADVL